MKFKYNGKWGKIQSLNAVEFVPYFPFSYLLSFRFRINCIIFTMTYFPIVKFSVFYEYFNLRNALRNYIENGFLFFRFREKLI